jgi:hypothetical protein
MVVARENLSVSPVRILAAILAAAALLFVGALAGASIAAGNHSTAGAQSTTQPAPVSGEHTASYGPR